MRSKRPYQTLELFGDHPFAPLSQLRDLSFQLDIDGAT